MVVVSWTKANALSKLGLAVQYSPPPGQGKEIAALAFAILAALQKALDQARAALADQNISRVTFPSPPDQGNYAAYTRALAALARPPINRLPH